MAVEYNISDYGVFSDAVSSTATLKNAVSAVMDAIAAAKQVLADTSIFEGPAQAECMSVFQSLDTDFSSIVANYSSISAYLTDAAAAYKSGDTAAANTILGNTASVNSETYLSSGTMVTYSYDGKNFNVVNTKIPVGEYEQYVQKYGVNQNAGLLGGDCMLLSQYYAKDLLTGKYTSKSSMAACQGGPAVRMNERCRSTNQQDVLDYTYNELSQGHPVVLQVSQVNSYKGWRHLVTAIGYDSSVTSSKDLNPNNILVLDCVDGKIQTLGKARSEGGHERTLFAQGGNYQALGPTEAFLAKEVTTGTQTMSA